jgi:hypothetical protein
MKSFTSLATMALLPLTSLAQSQSVISLFIMDSDPQPLVASVISADASTTDYEITCPSSVADSDCGFRPPVTVGQTGGSVYGASITTSEFTLSYQCTLSTSGATSAVCAVSAAGSLANFPGSSTETLMASDVVMFPVTITAGQEKLGTATTTAESGSSESGGSSSAAMTSSGSPASAANTGSSSASGTQAAATTTKKSSSGSGKVAAGCGGLLVVVALGFAMAL